VIEISETKKESIGVSPENNTDDTNMGERLAFLVSCVECGYHWVHYVYEETIEACIKSPSYNRVRTYCPKGCKKHLSLHSKQRSFIHAETKASNLRQVKALKDTAHAINMHMKEHGYVTNKDMYDYYKTNTGYESKGVPLPFRKWHRRVGGGFNE